MSDVIAPADAFRLLLSARYRRTTLKFADKIKSYAWFWYPKSSRIPTCVHATADRILKRLCAHIREGDIRLRGELRVQDPPADIDPQDCLLGELHIFDQTLTIYAQGLTPGRIYRRVFCVRPDVLKIVEDISKEPSAAGPVCKVRYAPPPVISNTITLIYDDADRGASRPNINQLPAAVLPRLKALGYESSGREIKKIGREKQFAERRGKVGKRHT